MLRMIGIGFSKQITTNSWMCTRRLLEKQVPILVSSRWLGINMLLERMVIMQTLVTRCLDLVRFFHLSKLGFEEFAIRMKIPVDRIDVPKNPTLGAFSTTDYLYCLNCFHTGENVEGLTYGFIIYLHFLSQSATGDIRHH